MADAADPPGPLKSPIGEAVRGVAAALAAIPAPAMIIGGIAVIARGVPRLTRDVDLTIAGGIITLPALLADLRRRHDLAPRIPEALAAAERLSLGGTEGAVARVEDDHLQGGGFRPQDQQDIERLLVLHRSNVDLARVRRVVGEFAAALDDTQRMDDLEKIIRHATNT